MGFDSGPNPVLEFVAIQEGVSASVQLGSYIVRIILGFGKSVPSKTFWKKIIKKIIKKIFEKGPGS